MITIIVEDDEPLALILSTLMKSMGKVEIAGSLGSMWAKIAAIGEIGLVVLDLNLPDSPSKLTLTAIRKIKEVVPKVVVMTGAYLPDITELAISAGADACFYKGDANFVEWLRTALKGPPGSRSPFSPPAL